MLLYGARDLAKAFRTVRKNTIQAAEEIPEAQLDFSPAAGTRTVRQLLTHIAMVDEVARTVHAQKMTSLQELNFPELIARTGAEEQKPRSKSELIALLTDRADSFATWLGGLSDEFLAEQVQMPAGMQPSSKTRFEMLMGVKEHEMHHRGQLMLVQRMLGQVPHLTRQRQEQFAAARR
jgi:uncharacterized damage-inducible protein DinB